MLRRAQSPDPADPHLPGARARLAALRRDGPVGRLPTTSAAHDAIPEPVPDREPWDGGPVDGQCDVADAEMWGDGAAEEYPEEGDAAGGGATDGVVGRGAADDGVAGRGAADDGEPVAVGWVPDRRPRGARPGTAWAARLTTAGPWGELAEKWVPESLRGARVDPKRRGALLLSSVAAIAAVAAALGVWWSRPQPTPVVASPSAASHAASSAASSTGSNAGAAASLGVVPTADGGSLGSHDTSSDGAGPTGPGRPVGTAATLGAPGAGTILISVTGRVRHPGVVTVPADARVADALAAAGGALDESDLTGLNLAARLSDGSSVVVAGGGGGGVSPDPGTTGSATGGAVSGAADAKISLNTADATALQSLAGVGPVTAAAIIAYRTEHGPFTDLAQLQDVSGIGPATFARLEPHVTL